jgi:hypothetical protein
MVCCAVYYAPPPPALMNDLVNMYIGSTNANSVFGEPVTFTAYITAPNPFNNVPVTGKVRIRLARKAAAPDGGG